MQPRLEMMPIGKIKGADKNPKGHDIPGIMASIRRFGFKDFPTVNEATGRLVSGHGRVKALKALKREGPKNGEAWPPANIVEKGRQWLCPVVRGQSWANDDEAAAYLAAHNQLTMSVGWDEKLLVDLLQPIANTSDMFAGMGFDKDYLEGLFGSQTGSDLEPPSKTPPDNTTNAGDDEVPDKIELTTKVGDDIAVGRHRVVCADCIELLRTLPDNSVDSICTDPPYGIGFMGKKWDCEVPGAEWAKECLRVLKPGGHLIAFAATRTMHRLGCAVEDAGFEIRDLISWLQWQGMPKSMDVSYAIDGAAGATRPDRTVTDPKGNQIFNPSKEVLNSGTPQTDGAKEWYGWGTGLKPAQEPALLARKPFDGTVVDNVLEHGTGGLNIDGCRIVLGDNAWPGPNGEWGDRQNQVASGAGSGSGAEIYGAKGAVPTSEHPLGRFPANIYVCPKPSRAEREEGTTPTGVRREDVTGRKSGSKGQNNGRAGVTAKGDLGNPHPTVKPVELMRWLVRLVTPPGGIVVDTFLGSGTTLMACEREGFIGIGVEMDPAYCDIALARIGAILPKRRRRRKATV